jgi:23S rRNA-/tRNA-specific pseudouridylate synthase
MSTRRSGAKHEYKTEEVTGNGHRDGDEHIENEPRKKSRSCETPVPVEAEIVSLDEFSTSPSNEQSPIEKQGSVGWNSSSRRRIRVVKPYPFTFSTFAKARWIGRSLLDVYHNEFGSYPRSYYESAIKEGRILVSGRQVSCDYKVKNADKLCHTVHRHEPAVSLCDYYHENELKSTPWVKVLYEDSKIIVVDKPATLPIHPCGAYYYNTLFHILSAQRPDHGTLHTVHRLGKLTGYIRLSSFFCALQYFLLLNSFSDRLTSGLTVIAKTPNIASSLTKSIMTRVDCQKIYLARVKGCFPLNASSTHICLKEKAVNGIGVWISDYREKQKQESTYTNVFHSRMKLTSSIIQDASTEKLSTTGQAQEDGEVLWLHLSCPCDVEDPKNGVCKAGKGKPAETAFSVVHYDKDSDTTIVMAKPITG